MVKKQQWMILDWQEGLVRIEPTRRAAVAWCTGYAGHQVESRDKFRDGAYRYVFGYGDGSDSGFSQFIEREDIAHRDWSEALAKGPKYPYADRPYVQRES